MDVMLFKVCGTSRDGSESGSVGVRFGVKMEWSGNDLAKGGCNREKRIAQIRREGAGEFVRIVLISKNKGCIVQNRTRYSGLVAQSNTYLPPTYFIVR